MNKHLYQDVLNEGSPVDFERAVLGRTMAAARRFRRTRIAGRAAAVALLFLVAVLQFFPKDETIVVKQVSEPEAVATGHQTLHSQPFIGIIRTEPASSAPHLSTTAGSIVVLKTGEADSGNVVPITDEQLLALFPGRSVALVKRSPTESELIFLDER